MDRLPELLALLYGARTHVTTARGVLTHRQNSALWPKAHERQLARMQRRNRGSISVQMTFSRRADRGPVLPDVHEETIRFWWEPPERLREEVSSNIPHQNRTVVMNGGLWWLHGEAMGAVTNELLDEEERAQHGVGGGERFRPLLDPSGLIPALEFDAIRPGEGVLQVSARLRDDLEGPHLHQLPLTGGADRFDLEVDAELGVVRAVTSWLDDDELEATRMEELVLGEAFPDEVFARPAGIEFEAAGGNVRQVTLAEAAAEAPFPVFYAPQLPEGLWRLRVTHIQKPHDTVWLAYHRADGSESVTIGQSTEAVFDPEGESVERDGTTYVVAGRAVAFERDGTKLVLQSDGLDADALLELASQLERFAG